MSKVNGLLMNIIVLRLPYDWDSKLMVMKLMPRIGPILEYEPSTLVLTSTAGFDSVFSYSHGYSTLSWSDTSSIYHDLLTGSTTTTTKKKKYWTSCFSNNPKRNVFSSFFLSQSWHDENPVPTSPVLNKCHTEASF